MIAYGRIVYSITINITEKSCEFLKKVIKGYLKQLTIDKVEEVETVSTSDLKDMIYTHYMEQPKSMICRKRIRRLFEVEVEGFKDFEHLVVCV